MLKVFVYGTLKPGESNYPKYCQEKMIDAAPAIIWGELFHLKKRGYPGLSKGNHKVYGILLTFPDHHILSDLDQLEDYQPERSPQDNEYQREEAEIFDLNLQSLGHAYVYFMLKERIKALEGIPLPDGQWTVRQLRIDC